MSLSYHYMYPIQCLAQWRINYRLSLKMKSLCHLHRTLGSTLTLTTACAPWSSCIHLGGKSGQRPRRQVAVGPFAYQSSESNMRSRLSQVAPSLSWCFPRIALSLEWPWPAWGCCHSISRGAIRADGLLQLWRDSLPWAASHRFVRRDGGPRFALTEVTPCCCSTQAWGTCDHTLCRFGLWWFLRFQVRSHRETSFVSIYSQHMSSLRRTRNESPSWWAVHRRSSASCLAWVRREALCWPFVTQISHHLDRMCVRYRRLWSFWFQQVTIYSSFLIVYSPAIFTIGLSDWLMCRRICLMQWALSCDSSAVQSYWHHAWTRPQGSLDWESMTLWRQTFESSSQATASSS